MKPTNSSTTAKSSVAIVVMALSCVALNGCGGPFSGYSNQELRTEFRKCDYSKLSAAGAQRCNNIKKECDQRKGETGFRC